MTEYSWDEEDTGVSFHLKTRIGCLFSDSLIFNSFTFPTSERLWESQNPLIVTRKRELPASVSTYGNSFTLTALERAEKLSVSVQTEDTRPRFSAFSRHGDPCLWSWEGQEDRTEWRAVPFNKEKASMLERGIPWLVRTVVFSVRKPASWDVPMSYSLLSFAFGSGSLFPSHVGGSAAANQTGWG